jgi:hypothetical protein
VCFDAKDLPANFVFDGAPGVMSNEQRITYSGRDSPQPVAPERVTGYRRQSVHKALKSQGGAPTEKKRQDGLTVGRQSACSEFVT